MEGHIVFATFRLDGQHLHLNYVESPPQLRGTGAAGQLMQTIMEYAQEKKLTISPHCGYAAAWMRKHPAYHALLHSI